MTSTLKTESQLDILMYLLLEAHTTIYGIVSSPKFSAESDQTSRSITSS